MFDSLARSSVTKATTKLEVLEKGKFLLWKSGIRIKKEKEREKILRREVDLTFTSSEANGDSSVDETSTPMDVERQSREPRDPPDAFCTTCQEEEEEEEEEKEEKEKEEEKEEGLIARVVPGDDGGCG
ncbi:hypothetical protein HZH68_000608 [Vespula germanica]|uniref:Uncharacterized protein n=1 Tax=Vespula germanica TaxID=30212 RepID=A0A834NTV7_VESGE|nr:hypothetical protein HZH68_000608 [Vespula germanica]